MASADKKIIVKNIDMPAEMKNFAIKISLAAIEDNAIDKKQKAVYIRNQFSNTYDSGEWECKIAYDFTEYNICEPDIGRTYINGEITKYFIHLMIDDVAVLISKIN